MEVDSADDAVGNTNTAAPGIDRVSSVVAIPHIHFASIPGLHIDVEWKPSRPLIIHDTSTLFE